MSLPEIKEELSATKKRFFGQAAFWVGLAATIIGAKKAVPSRLVSGTLKSAGSSGVWLGLDRVNETQEPDPLLRVKMPRVKDLNIIATGIELWRLSREIRNREN